MTGRTLEQVLALNLTDSDPPGAGGNLCVSCSAARVCRVAATMAAGWAAGWEFSVDSCSEFRPVDPIGSRSRQEDAESGQG